MRHEVAPVCVGAGLAFAEGINFGPDGTLYCVDVFDGNIWYLSPGREPRKWANTGGLPTGSRFGPNGDLFIADGGRQAILRFSTATRQESVYVDRFEGRPFLAPNDLCFGPDGTLFFTDPGDSTLDHRVGAVYAVAPCGAVFRIAAEQAFPNGIAVTPDGSALIMGECHSGVLRRYSLDSAHRYEELDPLCVLSPARSGTDPAGPDGIAFGADGNLYVAHYGAGVVRAIAPDGSIVASLAAGGPAPTNVAFWQDSLYVTEGSGGAIYRLDIGVREQPPFMRPW